VFSPFERLAIRSRAVLVIVLASGCGGGVDDNSIHCAGKATYKGQPIPYGTLVFNPDQQAGHKGRQGFATIEDGQYDTRTGTPVTPGHYVVKVTAYRSKPDLSGDETSTAANVAPLFPEYSLKLEVKSESQDIEVPESWPAKKEGRASRTSTDRTL